MRLSLPLLILLLAGLVPSVQAQRFQTAEPSREVTTTRGGAVAGLSLMRSR